MDAVNTSSTLVQATVALAGWSNGFIGLPWLERGLTRDGIACWGLARLVYGEVLGIEVPDYCAEVMSLQERAEVAAVFDRGVSVGPWARVDQAQPFDIAVFRRAGIAAHVGIVVTTSRMLHITAGQDSCLVDFTAGYWSPRLLGFYRHRTLMEVGRDG